MHGRKMLEILMEGQGRYRSFLSRDFDPEISPSSPIEKEKRTCSGHGVGYLARQSAVAATPNAETIAELTDLINCQDAFIS